MNSILLGTILVEIFIIFGVSAILRLKGKSNPDSFITSGRNMPTIAIAATIALTCLGGGHIMGVPGASWSFGMGAFWFVLSSGAMMLLITCFTAPWIRRFKFTTIPQLFEHMFDKKTSILMSGFSAGCLFALATLEIQGVGTVITALSGVNLTLACLIAGAIAMFYVIFGGMEEVGWVNVINSIIMYLGVFIALFYIGSQLPNGWSGVNSYYADSGNEWMLSILTNADTWRVYIIGTILANLFFSPISASVAQVAASAQNAASIRKATFLTVVMNSLFGIGMLAFGMAAKSLPQFEAIGAPPLATFALLINMLPGWLVAWLCASFAAAMLSTVAIQILALSTIATEDIYYQYYKKDFTPKQKMFGLRAGVVIISVLASLVSTALPAIENAIVWVFAWLLPAFWMFVFGLYWKQSANAAFYTFIVCGIFNMIWTFTPLPQLVRLEGNNNSIGLIVVSFVVFLTLTALDKNAKPGLAKQYKEDKNSVVHQSSGTTV